MTDRREIEGKLRSALANARAPEEERAEERGLQVIAAAFADQPKLSVRRRTTARLGVALASAVLIGALVLTPAGADVRDWIADRVDTSREITKQGTAPFLPAGGRVLVEAPSGVWVFEEDGSRRRLGDFDHGAWSPHGLFVAVSSGETLSAIEPDGDERWSLEAGSPVSELDWSTDDGDRIAYVGDRTQVRVAIADGSGDRLLARDVQPIAPAWRPDLSTSTIRREVAFVRMDGSVEVVDSETGRQKFSTAPMASLNEIEWSPGGESLVAVGRNAIERQSLSGRAKRWRAGSRSHAPARWSAAAVSPTDGQIAAVSRQRRQSTLHLLGSGTYSDLLSLPSRTDDVTWSPDGKWILLGLRDVDQWLFVRASDGSVRQVSKVSQLFDPGSTHGGAFPTVAGWCCPE